MPKTLQQHIVYDGEVRLAALRQARLGHPRSHRLRKIGKHLADFDDSPNIIVI